MALRFRDDPHGDQFFALKTFRRNGSPVVTPIWLASVAGRWYGYTPGRSWKVKRIGRTPRVEVAPSDFHGAPSTDFRVGHARILVPPELRVARRAMVAKYGYQFRFFMIVLALSRWRRHGGRAVGLEIVLEDDPTT